MDLLVPCRMNAIIGTARSDGIVLPSDLAGSMLFGNGEEASPCLHRPGWSCCHKTSPRCA